MARDNRSREAQTSGALPSPGTVGSAPSAV